MPLLRRPGAMTASATQWTLMIFVASIMSAVSALASAGPVGCAPFTIPSYGQITINPTHTITITTDVVFTPACTAYIGHNLGARSAQNSTRPSDPFHSSITPQAYATGAATVIAWMLVIMLLITPRTFFSGQAGETVTGLRGRRGLIGGARGGSSVIGIGSRPWLQKVAALTVAISLTIASVDTFRVAQQQYYSDSMNADDLRNEVVSSTRIKVSRVVSDIFLWLAQIQTLIRLFSRHKEKVLIKWIGFAMIVLDVTFSCLNTFISTKSKRDRKFVDAIPALNYLFQLALSMLYAAWVIYYAITKRRYAFYHKLMWNISVVALLSILSILTPVVFFITDISNSSVAGWGDYFRWVGAAAASVIVWEWVERIEALEREEKKDGILGREVFDGDEMLDVTSEEGTVTWPRGRKGFRRSRDDTGDSGGLASGLRGHGFGRLTKRLGRITQTEISHGNTNHDRQESSRPSQLEKTNGELSSSATGDSTLLHAGAALAPDGPIFPQPVASPVSRADTISAASTVYAVRYWPVGQSPPLQRQDRSSEQNSKTPEPQVQAQQGHEALIEPSRLTGNVDAPLEEVEKGPDNRTSQHASLQSRLTSATRFDITRHLPNPFKRHRSLPPAEIANAQVIEPLQLTFDQKSDDERSAPRRDMRSRLNQFAARRSEKNRDRGAQDEEAAFPVTIIPAMPRGRTWSPQDPAMLAQQLIPARPEPNMIPAMETVVETTSEGQDEGDNARYETGEQQRPQRDARPGA